MSDSSIYSGGKVVTTWPGATRLANAPRGAAPLLASVPAPRQCAAVIHTSSTIAAAHDARLLAILDRDDTGVPALAAFARKEKELGEAFAALPILDQRALHARLSIVRDGDLLADKFNRLTHERRTRLLNFLGDARRRAAQAGATKGALR
ncbi:MAG: hypothetical protein ABJE66_17865 [Deltaproteobacteria bacterium]